MKMRNITLNTGRIGIEIDFEAAVIHIFNFLLEIKSTCRILLIETEIEETDGGIESVNLSMVERKKCAKKYWKMG